MNPIYTKTGDKGKTRTFYGEMSKSDALAEALGSIDELNSWIGFARSQIQKSEIKNQNLDKNLRSIQNNLLIIGSGLAGSKMQRLRGIEVKKLEKWIDSLTKDLPHLKNFIYPTGEIQVARAVCRRAERKVVQLASSPVYQFRNKNIIKYLNRLSDALFTIARWVNFQSGGDEEIWA